MQDHHGLCKIRVSRALSKPVDRHLDLSGARFDCCDAVCNGKSVVIVAVHIERQRHRPLDLFDQPVHRRRHHHAHGVGDVDDVAARLLNAFADID